jgi:molecular chaperone DnaJ
MKDFYQILGVPESADDIVIKKSYRNLAKKYHPDANPGNKQAENKFKEISEAYDVLSDKQKRSQYDQVRRYGASGFEGFSGRRAQPGAGAGGSQGGFNFDDLSSMFGEQGGFGSFADIFSSIFGEGAGVFGGRQANRPMAGEDLYSEITVPFSTAAKGGAVNVRVSMTERCPVCQGSGAKPGSKPRACPECQGRGVISYMQGSFSVSRPCPKCLGRGQIIAEPCLNCRGTGSVRQPHEIAVKIPSGIESGKNIRLKGLGNPGANGGPSGDLYLRVNINKNEFFWREGYNIHCRVPITILQAAHGAKIRVRTIADKKVEVKIPPATKAGTRLRLRGLGLALDGQKGDQIVEIDIKKPEKITDEERKLYEELANKASSKK